MVNKRDVQHGRRLFKESCLPSVLLSGVWVSAGVVVEQDYPCSEFVHPPFYNNFGVQNSAVGPPFADALFMYYSVLSVEVYHPALFVE